MMKHKTLAVLTIALALASTGAMARSATAIDMVVFSGALVEHGLQAPLVTVIAPGKTGKAPALQLNSKVSDQNSHKFSSPVTPPPQAAVGSIPHQAQVTQAPEMDTASMGGALTLLIGAVAVLSGQRKQALRLARARR
jgi:hypothetical protein